MSDQMKVSLPEVHDICRRLYRQWREARITSSHDGIEAKSYVVPITSDDVMQLELAVDSCFEREQLPNEGRKLLAAISQMTGIRDDRLLTVDPSAWSELDGLAMDRESTMRWFEWDNNDFAPVSYETAALQPKMRLNTPLEKPQSLNNLTALEQWAGVELKGKQRQVILLVCQAGGELAIDEISGDPVVDWDQNWSNCFNSLKNALNEKLERLHPPWQLSRQKNCAVLNMIV